MVSAISAMDIAASGLSAQRVRMNVIANNIANAMTTRTEDGGPFRRQLAVFEADPLGAHIEPSRMGVRVDRVIGDPSPFRTVFDPGHPDANAEGYVAYPNVNLAVEMVDLVSAQRAYEANISVVASSKRILQKALDILQV